MTVTVNPGKSGTLVLQDGFNGYTQTRDASITAWYPDTNFGTQAYMEDQCCSYANLIRFGIFQSQGGRTTVAHLLNPNPIPNVPWIAEITIMVDPTATPKPVGGFGGPGGPGGPGRMPPPS